MPGGRPTDYNKQIADEICLKVKNSVRGLEWLCNQNEHWPVRSTVYLWMQKYPEFSDAYEKAKVNQADFMFDEMLDVAYNDQKDHKVVIDDKGNEKIICVSESVNRSRLKCDTLKYCAARLNIRKYSDKAGKDGESAASLIEKIIDKL